MITHHPIALFTLVKKILIEMQDSNQTAASRAARSFPLRTFTLVAVLAGIALTLTGCTNEPPGTATEDAPESQVAAPSGPWDVVIEDARVLDPETGLDAVRSVALVGRQIAAITEASLATDLKPDGLRIDASGQVLAPGFIDLHAHGQSARANDFQAMDGVTTALELEWGYPAVGAWIKNKTGKSRLNFGASVAHGMVRTLALDDFVDQQDTLRDAFLQAASDADPLRSFQGTVAQGFYTPLDPASFDAVLVEIDKGLREGALGIGMAHQYYPGATREEIYRLFEFAAEHQTPIYTHVREMGLGGVQEVVSNAVATGAPLHIVHLNSMSLGSWQQNLQLLERVRALGADVTAEAYPYTAGSTALQSAIFDDGWRERLGISYGDVQWQDTGERLTQETFNRYREDGGTVIIHMMKEEWIEAMLRHPDVLIASDGMPYAPGAHPRSAGTFSRVLGRYVREQKALDLMTAIRKMTLMPAKRLEGIAPAMAKKGRIQPGFDANLVLFDPETIIDTATFHEDLSYSNGVSWLFVNGVPVVQEGQLAEGATPGEAIVGRLALLP